MVFMAMCAKIGTVSTLCAPQNTTEFPDNLQLALETVDKSWTRSRVERLHMWCALKSSRCPKANMCADALTKHLDKSHESHCTDFLKMAFIVNNGLLMLDDEDLEGQFEADTSNTLSRTESAEDPPACEFEGQFEADTSNNLSPTESAVDPPACEFIQFKNKCRSLPSNALESNEEISLAEIEQEMNDIINRD